MEAIDNTTNTTTHKIIADYSDLEKTVEKPLVLNQVAVKDLQQIISSLFDLYAE